MLTIEVLALIIRVLRFGTDNEFHMSQWFQIIVVGLLTAIAFELYDIQRTLASIEFLFKHLWNKYSKED